MKKRSELTPRAAGKRARVLSDIARTLHERKSVLAYGEFEKWALRAFPRYPIQVLRYLRKAHRTFGKELPLLLERLGQKKVFLLVGLDDPWAPIRDGISHDGGHENVPVEQLSVSQLRQLISTRNGTESRDRDGWGPLGASMARIASLWSQVEKHPLASTLRRDGARRQLERFRALLRDALAWLDHVLGAVAARGPAPRSERASVKPAPRTGRDPDFLD